MFMSDCFEFANLTATSTVVLLIFRFYLVSSEMTNLPTKVGSKFLIPANFLTESHSAAKCERICSFSVAADCETCDSMYSRNQQLLNKSPANFVHQLQSGHPHFLSASVAQNFSFRCSKSANITKQRRAAVLSGRGFRRFLGLAFVEDHCLFWPGSLLRFLNSPRDFYPLLPSQFWKQLPTECSVLWFLCVGLLPSSMALFFSSLMLKVRSWVMSYLSVCRWSAGQLKTTAVEMVSSGLLACFEFANLTVTSTVVRLFFRFYLLSSEMTNLLTKVGSKILIPAGQN